MFSVCAIKGGMVSLSMRACSPSRRAESEAAAQCLSHMAKLPLLSRFVLVLKDFFFLNGEKKRNRDRLFSLFSPFNESLILQHFLQIIEETPLCTLYNVNTASIKHQLRKAKE